MVMLFCTHTFVSIEEDCDIEEEGGRRKEEERRREEGHALPYSFPTFPRRKEF